MVSIIFPTGKATGPLFFHKNLIKPDSPRPALFAEKRVFLYNQGFKINRGRNDKEILMDSNLGEGGYSKEEEYFFKQNKALLDKMRGKLDENRAEQASHAGENAHWMKCPKCGKDLVEEDLAGIKVDRCTSCLGIFFDKGELELLMEAKEPAGIFGGLKKIFKK